MNVKNVGLRKWFNKKTITKIKASRQLYMMFFLPLVWFAIFCYGPMYGLLIVFKDYRISQGILGSQWVGFKHFIRFFNDFYFFRIMRNTLLISVYGIIVGLITAIILAFILHYCDLKPFKKFAQTITYAPHFISTVVMVGMILQVLHPRLGIINIIIQSLGGKPISFVSIPSLFPHVFVWSGVWQHVGWSSIIYLAALIGVDPTLHEAAIVDGATKLKRAFYVDFPCIKPTILIIMILDIGGILSVGFEKIYLMQNDLNLDFSEVISTYVYKVGIYSSIPDYSYAAAIDVFNSFIGIILVVIANYAAKKMTETSLW